MGSQVDRTHGNVVDWVCRAVADRPGSHTSVCR